jgi:hypothetical protein
MELVGLLRSRPGWTEAMERLRELRDERGTVAAEEARGYANRYEGRRGAMVFDVVASRQRRYTTRVVSMVERFSNDRSDLSLRALATEGPGVGWGLRSGEGETMQNVASGLGRYCDDHGLDDEAGVRAWAAATTSVVDAHRLDPYVGSVSGIGPALFAYLRMRSGGDGIKPDVRVRKALNDLGFGVPPGDAALLRLAAGVAAECGISLLELDQMLWGRP